MATDYGIRILIDATVSDDKKAEIVRRVIQVLEAHTLALAHNAAYVEGSATDQVEITVT